MTNQQAKFAEAVKARMTALTIDAEGNAPKFSESSRTQYNHSYKYFVPFAWTRATSEALDKVCVFVKDGQDLDVDDAIFAQFAAHLLETEGMTESIFKNCLKWMQKNLEWQCLAKGHATPKAHVSRLPAIVAAIKDLRQRASAAAAANRAKDAELVKRLDRRDEPTPPTSLAMLYGAGNDFSSVSYASSSSAPATYWPQAAAFGAAPTTRSSAHQAPEVPTRAASPYTYPAATPYPQPPAQLFPAPPARRGASRPRGPPSTFAVPEVPPPPTLDVPTPPFFAFRGYGQPYGQPAYGQHPAGYYAAPRAAPQQYGAPPQQQHAPPQQAAPRYAPPQEPYGGAAPPLGAYVPPAHLVSANEPAHVVSTDEPAPLLSPDPSVDALYERYVRDTFPDVDNLG